MSGVTADKYYGDAARQYEARRSHTKRWANEQAAVEMFVTEGPVLDVPLGTGRYVPIYQAKGLEVVGIDISNDMLAEAQRRYPDLDARQGNVFSMPFACKQFGTAVCTRLLDWFVPGDMRAAVAELRRVAKELVLSIRHGDQGCRVNYTHSLDSFYQAIDGLLVDSRRTMEATRDGTEEILKLRPACWGDVIRQFSFCGGVPHEHINRIAGYSAETFGLSSPVLSADSANVRAEYWSDEDLWPALKRMSDRWDHKVKPQSRYITNDRPRYIDWPATILSLGGEHLILDGRRRINQWTKTPGRYPVLVIEA